MTFQQLQETDFNKKVEKYEDRQDEYPSTKEYHDAIMKEVHSEIRAIINQLKTQMKDNSRRGENQDILFFFQTLIHDAALTR